MARFQEIFSCWGVTETDARGVPNAGIIVPIGPAPDKFNLVRLTDGRGLRVGPAGSPITVDEITERDRVITMPSAKGLMVLPVAPFTTRGDRLFKISGQVPGTNFWVEARGNGGGPTLTLKVAVLKPRPVKLAIKPVLVRDPLTGAPTPHSKVPYDFNAMVDQMNAVWTPQANVVFTLVSSFPAVFTDEARIAKSVGVTSTDPKIIAFPEDVDLNTYIDLLNENKDKNANLTMFLVKFCSSGSNHGEGWTRVADGVSLISDKRTEIPELMAHEAGHFLGGRKFDHMHTDDLLLPDAKDKNDNDKRLQLMHQGGPNYKVPFDLVNELFNPQ
ncbi:MAG TPA: hypothetical protein VGR70_15245 [Stellaceae bacterium]|nr:hypothetical protein [Stellaceae bacterium]